MIEKDQTKGNYRVIILNQRGERLDKALSEELPDISRSRCQQLIADRLVTIDGLPVKASQRIEGGERVEVFFPDAVDSGLTAQDIPVDIIYEDTNIIVVDKKAGMVVHPSPGHIDGTLVNALLAHCPDLEGIGGEKRPGIVHRLDRDTSGLIVVAKNDTALKDLQNQFKRRKVDKLYLALVDGLLVHKEMIIDARIGRDPYDRKKMAVVAEGTSSKARKAVTHVKRKRRYQVGRTQGFSYLECRPETGRTHQVRVHLAYAGHPIVGDRVYGRKRPTLELDRHFLHAAELTLRMPGSESLHTFKASLPGELQKLLDDLEAVE